LVELLVVVVPHKERKKESSLMLYKASRMPKEMLILV
jgi:hypothetical protein